MRGILLSRQVYFGLQLTEGQSSLWMTSYKVFKVPRLPFK